MFEIRLSKQHSAWLLASSKNFKRLKMFEIRLSKQPIKYLKKQPEKLQKAFFKCFEALEGNPFLLAEPLHGPLKGKWKIALGDFRIIGEIYPAEQVVKIIFIGPRGDVYK